MVTNQPPADGQRQSGAILEIVGEPPVPQRAMRAPRREMMQQGSKIDLDRLRGPADPEDLLLDQPGREAAERSAGMRGGTRGARGLGGAGRANERWGDAAGGRRMRSECLLEPSRSPLHDDVSMV